MGCRRKKVKYGASDDDVDYEDDGDAFGVEVEEGEVDVFDDGGTGLIDRQRGRRLLPGMSTVCRNESQLRAHVVVPFCTSINVRCGQGNLVSRRTEVMTQDDPKFVGRSHDPDVPYCWLVAYVQCHLCTRKGAMDVSRSFVTGVQCACSIPNATQRNATQPNSIQSNPTQHMKKNNKGLLGKATARWKAARPASADLMPGSKYTLQICL